VCELNAHFLKKLSRGLVIHTCNPSTLEDEAEGLRASLGYIARPCLKTQNKNTSQTTKKKRKEK
jgi:hypothetical protein